MIAPLFGSITRPLLSPLVSGLRDELFGAFTPRSLFNDGSIGVLYDNNDLTTMFVDAAGTTPATVNGLVGLQLDKSQGLVLGAELAPGGGTFDSATGYTLGAGWSIAGGTASRTDTGSFSNLTVGGVCVVGKFYEISVDIISISASAVVFGATWAGGPTFNTTGRKTVRRLATTTDFLFQMTGPGTVSLDNLSIREIPGNHRYQTTTGSKPILRGTPTGGNLAPNNGDFSSSTGWSLQAGWTISGGTANVNSAVAGSTYARATGTSVVGRVYRIKFTITSYTSGGISACAGTAVGPPRTSAGTYVEYIVANTTDGCGVYGASTTTVASVDNIEIHDVSAGSVTAPYGLQYDGVDDFLQTASVNFTATDKMFVCAGVRKLSDSAADSYLLALSASPANTGSFFIRAPRLASTAHYGFTYNASTAAGYDASSYAAPAVNVLSASMNGAGATQADKLIPRVNGATPTLGLIGVSSGTGNFGNHAFYFGRLGGTSGPFNGLDFGFVIVGKTLTAAQIASTERWMAQRTGVSI